MLPKATVTIGCRLLVTRMRHDLWELWRKGEGQGFTLVPVSGFLRCWSVGPMVGLLNRAISGEHLSGVSFGVICDG